MPTQAERLTTLEFDLKQFKTETLKAYTDMAYEMMILKGLEEDSIKRLAALGRRVDELYELVDLRFNQVLDEFNAHSLLLRQILERLD